MSTNASGLSPLKRALIAIDDLQERLAAAEQASREPLAVIGIGCRIPGGGDTPDALWRLLLDGVSAVRDVPPDRWDVDRFYDPDPEAVGKMSTRRAAFLDAVDRFDAGLFGISPREAATMDPQQRLLLEVVWEALEHAGYATDRLSGSRTGMFVGICSSDYVDLLKQRGPAVLDAHYASGVAHSIASGRIAYILGLQGPAVSVDTACSSSLVAVHLACQSLRVGDSRMAIAAGVNLMLAPDLTVVFSKTRMLAPDGVCRTFDAAADGFGRGEGCGAVVLKRLRDAVADGDRVLAVVRGTAINQDGASSSLTAPNGPAQEAVIRDALTNGGVNPLDVTYVEAHGTGTPLGDPIEIQALAGVLGAGRPADQPLLVGSIKTNVGHLEAAAGVAGLIKLVLALHHGEIPPHLNFRTPNPHVDWDALPVAVPTVRTPWPAGRPRIGGVSAFGFSGTNVHLVLEAPAARTADPVVPERPVHVLAVSARGDLALERRLKDLSLHLAAPDEADVADICYTANVGRAHHAERVAIVAGSRTELCDRVAALSAGQPAPGSTRGSVRGADRPPVAFLFTGQGAQYARMGGELYETQPSYRSAIDRTAEAMRPHLSADLRAVLFDAGDSIDQTMWTQPALFAVEYGLALLWQSWGVRPGAVLGHSIGEFAAACVAGVLSLEDAARLIAVRGRLMQNLPHGGAMAAVFAGEAQVARAIEDLRDRVAIGAVNGPDNVVVSGADVAVDEVLRRMASAGVRAKRLVVSHAFHSPLLDPMLDEFEREAATVTHRAALVPVISNLTGQPSGPGTYDAKYWRRHARQTVRFADGLRCLYERGFRVFVECGPNPTLTGLGPGCVANAPARWLASLKSGRGDWQVMAATLAELYASGADIDWAGFDRDYHRHRVSLPTYPFERERHWLPASRPRPVLQTSGAAVHPLIGSRLESPALPGPVYQSLVDRDSLPFLYDHRILDTAIVPAAAFLDAAVVAARRTYGTDASQVADVVIGEAMVLPEEGSLLVQTVIRPESPDAAALEVFSTPAADGAGDRTWTRHATARLCRRGVAPGATPDDGRTLGAARARCTTAVSRDDFYRRMRDRGIQFGPSFLGITELHCAGREAVVRAETTSTSIADYAAYPPLLDTALQAVAAALFTADAASDTVYLPVSVERFWLDGRIGASLWTHAVLREMPETTGTLCADVRLFGEDGAIAGELSGLRLLRANREALSRVRLPRLEDWMYQVRWDEAAPPPVPDAEPQSHARRWLVLADRRGIGRAVARDLMRRGDTCVVVARAITDDNAGEIAIDAADPAAYKWLVRESGAAVGVIHCWGMDAEIRDGIPEERPQVCRDLLFLVQSLAGRTEGRAPRLFVVTRGGQPVEGASLALDAEQSAVWGLAHTIAFEHPELHCTRLDLDPYERDDANVSALTREVLAPSDEDRIGYRNGRRFVARLSRANLASPAVPRCYRLEPSERGSLDSLRTVTCERSQPGPHEVEIRVRATALNFRDVMSVLGLYPGEPGPLGGECAGTVVSVGSDVVAFRPGDEVVAVAAGSFASHVIAHEALVAIRPPELSVERAASVPIAYITAHFALNHLARLRAGQRVLVHAAAGGVGLAAVHLARLAGAEIFATAGTDEKRALLRSLGVGHVMNSRTTDFRGEIDRLTGGRGVDVVLNSLGADFIESSFAVLADGGTFLEIGKNGIWPADRVASLGRKITYHVIDWSDDARREPTLVGGMLRDLVARAARGALPELPRREFALAEAKSAFRLMAQGRHVGKIIVRHPEPADADAALVRADATYLVTGGLGGLGLVAADWLVARGARNLVLAGRHAPSGEAAAAIDALTRKGASILTAEVDVSDRPALQSLLDRLRRDLPPLRGVIHAAGVFADGVLLCQTWDRFAESLAPKVRATALLDELTREDPIDFFVLYSSIASVFGAPGQGNYAAANAYEDATAVARVAAGRPALSISWGAWADVGAAVRHRVADRTDAHGFTPIPPVGGIAALERALRAGLPHVVIAPIDWTHFTIGSPASRTLPLLSGLVQDRSGAQPSNLVEPAAAGILATLAQAPPGRRTKLLLEHVRVHASVVLGLDPSDSIDECQPLHERGLDSLMAVELRNVLGRTFGQTLPATLLFDYPTLAALVGYLGSIVAPDANTPPVPGEPKAPPAETDLLKSIEGMSDDDVERLFAERMGQRH